MLSSFYGLLVLEGVLDLTVVYLMDRYVLPLVPSQSLRVTHCPTFPLSYASCPTSWRQSDRDSSNMFFLMSACWQMLSTTSVGVAAGVSSDP